MHPEITQALMAERVREHHAAAAVWRTRDARRRPRILPRSPRLRAAWAARWAAKAA